LLKIRLVWGPNDCKTRCCPYTYITAVDPRRIRRESVVEVGSTLRDGGAQTSGWLDQPNRCVHYRRRPPATDIIANGNLQAATSASGASALGPRSGAGHAHRQIPANAAGNSSQETLNIVVGPGRWREQEPGRIKVVRGGRWRRAARSPNLQPTVARLQGHPVSADCNGSWRSVLSQHTPILQSGSEGPAGGVFPRPAAIPILFDATGKPQPAEVRPKAGFGVGSRRAANNNLPWDLREIAGTGFDDDNSTVPECANNAKFPPTSAFGTIRAAAPQCRRASPRCFCRLISGADTRRRFIQCCKPERRHNG